MAQVISPVSFFCQKVLPAVFDDSLAYYESLCKMRDTLNKAITVLNGDSETIAQLTDQLNRIDELMSKVASGEYADLYLEQLESYINENLVNYVARLAYYLFPGLQYDSDRNVWRYVLRIPSSWKWLKFAYIWDSERHAWYIGLKY